MARIEKTVFISYRRADVYTALAVYENLKNQGYDIFFDYRSIASGDFEQVISSNIRARAHFILILTPTALDRCNEPGDWLRREIELAMDEKRNIVPLFFKRFRFGTPSQSGITKLLRFGKPDVMTGKLKDLTRYNGLNVHEDYFEEGMNRLRIEFLSKPLDTVLHPVSTEVQKVVEEEKHAADEAIKQKEDKKEPIKLVEEKPDKQAELEELKSQAIRFELKGEFWDALQVYYKIKKLDPTFPRVDVKIGELEEELKPKPVARDVAKRAPASSAPRTTFQWQSMAKVAGIVSLLLLFIWGSSSLWNDPTAVSTQMSQSTATATLEPVNTSTPSADLGIGSTMTGEDGMTLLYVPAGEFTMGSEDGNDNEKPVHTVYLDAFWIDQTEVTNAMYAKCEDAGVCDPPSSLKTYTRASYYGNSKYDNYPVSYVSWDDANAYCSWVGRRLPTEAQWEKAASWDNVNQIKNVYPWGDEIHCSLANYQGKYSGCFGDTTAVGSYPDGVSPYGALDMAGNVWEWAEDWYDESYYENSPSVNPIGPSSGLYRVLRGGAWENHEDLIRSATRYRSDPLFTGDIGFRCAMDANPEEPETSQESNTPSPTEETLGIGSTMTGADGMTLLYVPAGEFIMGSEDGSDDEKPVHTVYLDAFWIDQTEVSVHMYYLCVEAGACDEPSEKSSATNDIYYGDGKFDNYPVLYVSWNDANAYCSWADRRLPTEAEWEKAARGTDGNMYPWGNDVPSNTLLNFNDNVGDTTEVGSYPKGASPYGALDMAGNVSEWVEDWYDPYPGNTTDDWRYSEPYRVTRGGLWFDNDGSVRSADRAGRFLSITNSSIGFRCANSK